MMSDSPLSMTEARARFAELPARLATDRTIVVQKNGRPVMAVVDPEYLETLLETVEVLSDTDAMRALVDSLDDLRAGRVVERDEARRRLDLDD